MKIQNACLFSCFET